MNKPVAVIILNWNGFHLLQSFLPVVVGNTDTIIADIFVAENCSKDNSVAFIEKEFPR